MSWRSFGTYPLHLASGCICSGNNEDLLAERRLEISYETVRSWVLKFGPVIARRLRRRRPRPGDRWHRDEMVVRIAGKRMYLWRAVDHEGEVLDGVSGHGLLRFVHLDPPGLIRSWKMTGFD
jgi:DDE domain